ncbi:hypothetical protein EXU34_08815 [Alteromonas sp. ZYF713]|nr:hypothetical protein [Alteromonas sp. ZYF713]
MDERTLQKAFEIKSLSDKDRQYLKKQYWLIAGFSLFSGGIFFVIFTNVLSGSQMSSVPLYIFGLFALIFATVIMVVLRQNYLELKHGIKHCYTGVVTNKRVNRHTSSTGSHATNVRAGYGSRRTTTRTTYFICLDDEEFSVNAGIYNHAITGDKVYLEISPQKKQVLLFRVIEPQSVTDSVTPGATFAELTQDKECAISAKERLIVRRIFFKMWRKKLFFFLVIALFFMSVFASGFILFTVPLAVVLIINAYKLLMPLLHYRQFLLGSRPKIITSVRVKDKITLTSNRSKTRYRLVTSEGPLDVTEAIYSKVAKSDVLAVYRAVGIDIVFGVQHKQSNALFYLD